VVTDLPTKAPAPDLSRESSPGWLIFAPSPAPKAQPKVTTNINLQKNRSKRVCSACGTQLRDTPLAYGVLYVVAGACGSRFGKVWAFLKNNGSHHCLYCARGMVKTGTHVQRLPEIGSVRLSKSPAIGWLESRLEALCGWWWN